MTILCRDRQRVEGGFAAQDLEIDVLEFGFAVDWMRKDLGICIDEATRNGVKLPVTEMVDGFYGEVQGRGGNRFDTSSLILNLKNP